MEKPLLTISLLCSGRDEVKKCLDSLERLRKRVPCELILVDTGCDEKMRELLLSYTKEVVSFAWCDDFAKARNAGLERARGEWFLYLDDDEYFIDTGAIEKFFLSGEYRDFGYAAYTVRNFFDEELKNYRDTSVARLYSLKEGGKFQGIVHEQFEPHREPAKVLSTIAEHTGYIYKTPKDEKRHSLRNAVLLEKAVAEEENGFGDDADKMRLRAHLAQEYFSLKEYQKLSDFCKETLQKFEKQDERDCNRHRGCFYCGEILAGIFLEEQETAISAYEEAVLDKRNTGYTTAYLMTLGVELFRQSRENEKAAECCKWYLKFWEYYREKPERLFAEQTFFVMEAFYDETRNRIYCCQICLDLEKGDIFSLQKYFDLLGWEKDVVYITEDFMPCLVKAMAELPQEEIFTHMAEVLVNKAGMDIFWEELEKIEEGAGIRQVVRILSGATEGIAGRTAVELRRMLQAERDDNWGDFSTTLKNAVSICPMLGKVLKHYAEAYGKRRINGIGKQDVSEQKNHEMPSEIETLAKEVKKQILLLYSQNMKREALDVLEQLKGYVPEDIEISELEKKILEEI